MMRLSVVKESEDGISKGRASVVASQKLLKWIAEGNLDATHPDFDVIAKALGRQGAFAALNIDFAARKFKVRLRGISLNAQKSAAAGVDSLPGGFPELDTLRKEALRAIQEARPPEALGRGSKVWYQEELRRRNVEIQAFKDQTTFLTAAMKEYLTYARQFALAAGKGREFDRLQLHLLRKYGPVGVSNG